MRVAFYTSADATREAAEHVCVFALDAASDRNHVTSSPVLIVLRTENVIEQRAFVEFGVLHFGVQRKPLPRHFEHVVDVAGFRSAPVNAITEHVLRAEIFVFAVSARSKTVMFGDNVPEKMRRVSIRFVAGVS